MIPDFTAQLILDHTADTSQFGHMRRRYIESALENLSACLSLAVAHT